MTLAQKIKSNPYLRVSNCTDIADLEAAMDELRKLDAEYGDDNKTLLKLWSKFLDKKNKIANVKKEIQNFEQFLTEGMTSQDLKRGSIVEIIQNLSAEQRNQRVRVEVERCTERYLWFKGNYLQRMGRNTFDWYIKNFGWKIISI